MTCYKPKEPICITQIMGKLNQLLDSEKLKVLMPQVYLLKLKFLKHFSHPFKFRNTDQFEESHGMVPLPFAFRGTADTYCTYADRFCIPTGLPIDF